MDKYTKKILSKKIDMERTELVNRIKSADSLTDSEIVSLSKKLDEDIVSYMKLDKGKIGMKFMLWYGLNIAENLQEQKENMDLLLEAVVKISGSYFDDEGIYKTDLILNDLQELLEVACILDDDIVIYGSDRNILTTVKTLHDMGLD